MPHMGMGGGMGVGTNVPQNQPSFNAIFGNNVTPPQTHFGGSGPNIVDSFKKDGFNIMGKNPIPQKNEEGSKEFAELFSIADTKIKDRAHEKPKFDLNYNPA
jgi:hypothetical protein